MSMSQKVREEMLPRLQQRHAGPGRQGRSRLIDELCEPLGYGLRYAIKLLNARPGWGGDPQASAPLQECRNTLSTAFRLTKPTNQGLCNRLSLFQIASPSYT